MGIIALHHFCGCLPHFNFVIPSLLPHQGVILSPPLFPSHSILSLLALLLSLFSCLSRTLPSTCFHHHHLIVLLLHSFTGQVYSSLLFFTWRPLLGIISNKVLGVVVVEVVVVVP